MKLFYAAILLLTAAASSQMVFAEPRSVGGVFSFSGINLSYQHVKSESSFYEFNAGIDFEGILGGDALYPGIRAGFTYNFIFFSHTFDSGTLSTYAGIGFAAGYLRDRDMSTGPMAGLQGKIGLEYRFHVPVILSLDFSPVLGLHLDSREMNSSLNMYMGGLLRAYYPRLGIRYCF